MSAKEIKTKTIIFEVLESNNVYRKDILNFIKNYVFSNSLVHTDSYSSYKGIDELFNIVHKHDVHKKFEFYLISEIEGVFGVLRILRG